MARVRTRRDDHTRGTRATTRRRRFGAFLMAGSVAMGTALASLTPAVAQEEPTAPEETQPLEVTSTAYWTYPASDALPATLTSEFPPGVVCILAPELCPESIEPVGEQVEGALGTAEESEPNPPEDPVPPDSLPVGIQNGAERYEAAARFEIPATSGEQVDRFIVVLTEKQPTYHSSSPAFRQAVLAALTCARECEQEQFQKTLEKDPAESAVIGVEACPFTAAFEEGPSQTPPAEGQPVDCLYGGNGTRVPGTEGIWLFDLTFAAGAWADGSLANNGVLFRAAGAPNLAYGDPDPTTTAQATFEATAIAAAIETSPAQPDPEPFAPAPDTSGSDDSFSGSSSGGFSSAPSGGVSSDSFASAPAMTTDEAASAPQVAEPAPAGAGELATAPVAGVVDDTAAGSAWWIWLLVPIFAAGSWLTAQSLTAEVALGTARERSGAMTRLIARNQGSAVTSSPMTQV